MREREKEKKREREKGRVRKREIEGGRDREKNLSLKNLYSVQFSKFSVCSLKVFEWGGRKKGFC